MINSHKFLEVLNANGINSFFGVPDSLLKHFCACLAQELPRDRYVVCANEGNAMAMAAGHYLGTGKPACVFMQNSGEGNAVNPLLSLHDPDVYGIPCLLVIGWRGEPGIHDEPQHAKQGKVTQALLNAMDIPWRLLPDDMEGAKVCVEELSSIMRREGRCCALIVRKAIFDVYAKKPMESPFTLSREEAITNIIHGLMPEDLVVSTTGFTSRELFELRERDGVGHNRDFLTVGSMGHTSSIALGLAMVKPECRIYCLDGDGSFLMHMGGAAVVAASGASNLRHIVFNNSVHDSVGGQPIGSQVVDYELIGRAFGYSHVFHARTKAELEVLLFSFAKLNGPSLLIIDVKPGARKDLGRPTLTPREIKRQFMERLGIPSAE